MDLQGSSRWRSRLLISGLCLMLCLFWTGQTMPLTFTLRPESRDEVVMVTVESWKRCSSVALDPRDNKWSCCGYRYPFHRDSQRCCSTMTNNFLVIPKDNSKSEHEECMKYDKL